MTNEMTARRPFDLKRIENGVREILLGLGEDPERDGLKKTPARVAKMYDEVFSGLLTDPSRHLDTVFEESYDGVIVLRDIEFTSMCEHHLLAFTGVAHVAYIPGEKNHVVGLSKLARLVDEYARRPQLQERMTRQIAEALQDKLKCDGIAVVVEARHTCMSLRGVRKNGTMVTSSMKGVVADDARTRQEVMSLLYKR